MKAVSGFNCRLCKTFIRCGNDVINHIKGKKHQNNYKVRSGGVTMCHIALFFSCFALNFLENTDKKETTYGEF